MFQFILTNILMVSAGVVIYVMVRTLPRIESQPQLEKKNILERWIASEIPERIDRSLNGFLVKFLRKLKVWLLKMDNFISGHLQKIKPGSDGGTTNGNGKPKPVIDFKEMAAEKNGDKPIANGENLSNNQMSGDRT